MDVSKEEWFKAMRLDKGMSAEIEKKSKKIPGPVQHLQVGRMRFTDKRECSVRRRRSRNEQCPGSLV